MKWGTSDPLMLDGWLVVADAIRASRAHAGKPYVTEVLGRPVQVWMEGGEPCVVGAGGERLLAQSRYSHVWVCPSGRPARDLFAFPEAQAPGWRLIPCGGIGVATSHGRVIENFLDMGHFPFVHDGVLGAPAQAEVPGYQLRVDDAADEVCADDCRFWQPTDIHGQSVGRFVHYRYRAMLPCASILHKSTTSASEMELAIGLFVQPCAEERVIAYMLIALRQSGGSDDAEVIARQHHIFGQDKPILENQRPKRLPLAPSGEMPVRADAMSSAYRRLLQRHGCTFGTM